MVDKKLSDFSDVVVNETAYIPVLTDTGVNGKITSKRVFTQTNCITEIPQDIKLELNNDTLTFKSGSKVYIPNGFEQDGTTPHFDELIIENDATRTEYTNGQYLTYYRPGYDSIYIGNINASFSGTTPPVTGFGYWYDLENNLVKRTQDGGETWISGFSLPFSNITVSNGAISTINQVFNGFGYINKLLFVLPGVKGISSDGLNEDGTPKNIEITIDSVKRVEILDYTNPTMTFAVSNNGIVYHENYFEQNENPNKLYTIWYDTSSNTLYNIGNTLECQKITGFVCGTFARTFGTVSNLNINLPFISTDYNKFAKYKKSIVDNKNITNCVTAIPQDIHFSLDNGTLKLKAGSKVYIPNEGTNFISTVVPNDITLSINADLNGQVQIHLKDGNVLTEEIHTAHGSTLPATGSVGQKFYHTTENIFYRYDGSSWNVYSNFSLPLARVSVVAGVPQTIDYVYNGWCNIEGYAFVLPNVKGLVPDGRNYDGTLVSEEIVVDKVLRGDSGNAGEYYIAITQKGIKQGICYCAPTSSYTTSLSAPTTTRWWNPDDNRFRIYDSSTSSWINDPQVHIAVVIKTSANTIDYITKKYPLEIVDSNSKKSIYSNIIPDLTTAITISELPFTAPYDCYVFITASRNSNSGSAGYITLNDVTIIQFNNVAGDMVGDSTTQFMISAGDTIGVSGNAKFTRGIYCKTKG